MQRHCQEMHKNRRWRCRSIRSTGLLVEKARAHKGVRDGVGIAVAAGSTVLQVALLILGNGPWNADAHVAVGHARAELVDAARLADAGQPALVVLAPARIVRLDVLLVPLAHALDCALYLLDTSLGAHRLGREVGVRAGAVPRAGNWLWVQGHHDAELLGYSVQDEPGHPQIVSSRDS